MVVGEVVADEAKGSGRVVAAGGAAAGLGWVWVVLGLVRRSGERENAGKGEREEGEDGGEGGVHFGRLCERF